MSLTLLHSPLRRAAATIATLLALAAVVVLDTGAGQPEPTATDEPYSPFRMTYTLEEAGGATATVKLTWRSKSSWTAELAATSGDSRHIGRTVTYDGATLTIDDPLSGVDTFNASGTDSVGVVPDKWLIPREFAASNGWQVLGVGPDGYEEFTRTEDVAGKQISTSYKRDPASGIVTGFTESVDGRLVTSVVVTSLASLPASEATSGPAPKTPPSDPEPQPTSTTE